MSLMSEGSSEGQTSTSVGTDLCPHMLIIHDAHNDYPLVDEQAHWTIRPISVLWGSKVPQNV